MWSLSDKHQVLYQSDGGILHSRNGIHGLINEAKERGAEIRTQTEVKSWESDSECVSIELSGKTLTTDSVVITTGPWASETHEMRDLLTVERHLVSYLNYTTEDELFTSKNAPIWIFDGGEENLFYGAPSIENATEIKLGNLSPNSETGPISQLERGWDLYELLPEVEFARSNFSSQPSTVRGEVCPLTHSPDGNFIIDESVEYDNVYYGVGLSGHGLKLAPAIGRLLSDCVIKDKTKPMFSLTRFEE
jgi:glycine/D-amino acid oxidase-like deaminating enzyme